PISGGTHIAWSEFNATTIGPTGPQDYGVFVYDFQNGSGRYVCMNPEIPIGGRTYRCFGEHLTWPATNLIVTGQDLVEIRTDLTGAPRTIWQDLNMTILNGEVGTPDLNQRAVPFFPRFPLSISYARD